VVPSNPVSSLLLSELQVRLDKIFLGAGKTTLLNFLSGRDISKNLEKTGEILVNG
jgi:hypothetical protein